MAMSKQETKAFLAQFGQAKIDVAKTALTHPFLYSEGRELVDARRKYIEAKVRLQRAERAWDALIAPAGPDAKDPLEED